MLRNEGNIDRALRIIAGIVLIALVFVGPQTNCVSSIESFTMPNEIFRT